MPRYLLVILAILTIASWSLVLFGPSEGRDVFVGYAQGTTIGAIIVAGVVELGVRLYRRGTTSNLQA